MKMYKWWIEIKEIKREDEKLYMKLKKNIMK